MRHQVVVWKGCVVGSDLSPSGWKSDQVLSHSVIRRYTPPSQLSCVSIYSGAIEFFHGLFTLIFFNMMGLVNWVCVISLHHSGSRGDDGDSPASMAQSHQLWSVSSEKELPCSTGIRERLSHNSVGSEA